MHIFVHDMSLPNEDRFGPPSPRNGNGFSGRLLYYLQFPNRIWNFKPDFCSNDWKYGSLGICTFFPAQKILRLMYVEAQWFLAGMFLCRASQERQLCMILGQNFLRSFLAVLDSRNLISAKCILRLIKIVHVEEHVSEGELCRLWVVIRLVKSLQSYSLTVTRIRHLVSPPLSP